MLLTALEVGKVIAQQAMPASGADRDQNGRQDVLVLPDGLGGPAVQPLEQFQAADWLEAGCRVEPERGDVTSLGLQ